MLSITGWIVSAFLPWTLLTTLETKLITDVQLSPDHQSALVVVRNAADNEFLNTIYKISVEEKEVVAFSSPLFSSAQPKWSPDGKWVAFVSKREGVHQLYLIPSDGGEAVPLTKGKKHIQTFSWSPDSKKIAFVMEEEMVSTEMGYEYLQNTSVNRLWRIDPFSSNASPEALTPMDLCMMGSGDFGATTPSFDWSPNGKQIALSYTERPDLDSFYMSGGLAILDLETKVVSFLEKTSSRDAFPRYSPDGTKLAYLIQSSPYKYAQSFQVAVYSFEDKIGRPLAQTPNGGIALGDLHLLGWTKKGDGVLFFEPYRTKNHLVFLPVDGSPAKELDTGDHFFSSPALAHGGTCLAFVKQSSTEPPEAYFSPLGEFNPVCLSSFNQDLLTYMMPKTEVIRWASSDGLPIEGLLTYPTHYTEGKQYPLLLVIHGGPMGSFQETFIALPYPYPIAPFAEEGFFILRPNPRGSTGYGSDFRYANYKDWGGMDFADLMTGVDALVAKGCIDPERLGVMGWSYGGYMTAWTITQTPRFKAASMGAGVTNLVSMASTTDLHSFLDDYFGDFFDARPFYEKCSPLNYALNVSTPCLIQHGINDRRVPVSQSLEFYHALVRAGQKPTLILYPNTEHNFSSPKILLEAMQKNFNWFTKALQYSCEIEKDTIKSSRSKQKI